MSEENKIRNLLKSQSVQESREALSVLADFIEESGNETKARYFRFVLDWNAIVDPFIMNGRAVWFNSVSLGGRKSCPACKHKIDGLGIFSYGEYQNAKYRSYGHCCSKCYKLIRCQCIRFAIPSVKSMDGPKWPNFSSSEARLQELNWKMKGWGACLQLWPVQYGITCPFDVSVEDDAVSDFKCYEERLTILVKAIKGS